jgi:hypothetical protein
LFLEEIDSMTRHHTLADDSCEPAAIDFYAKGDVETVAVRDLYVATCARVGVTPAPAVVKQLPTEAGEHITVEHLDCSAAYLGARGCAAVVPVIACLPRLTTLTMSQVGMTPAVGKALVLVLLQHPAIREVDVSYNDLGSAVAQMLLRLVSEHRRVHTLHCEHALVIEPIQRKIRKHLAHNTDIIGQFSVPLLPDRQSAAALAAIKLRAEEEAARAVRQEEERQRIAERIPTWAPAALLELATALFQHRFHMENVFAVFQTTEVGATTISGKAFLRAMRILDVATLSNDEAKACEFCSLFGAWDRRTNLINYPTVVAALRAHASVTKAPDGASVYLGVRTMNAVPAPIVALLDRIYDVREALVKSFESLDLDQRRVVSRGEAAVGIAAVTRRDVAAVAVAVQFVLYGQLPPSYIDHLSSPRRRSRKSAPEPTESASGDDAAGDDGDVEEEEEEEGEDEPVVAVEEPAVEWDADAPLKYDDFLARIGIGQPTEIEGPRQNWDLARATLLHFVPQDL